jgi:hypothetical protein
MAEAWSLRGRERLMVTERDLEESADDIGRGRRLLEVTLRTADALAWNPAARDKAIRGPGVVQYMTDHRGAWVVRLHPIGRCMAMVPAHNDEAPCPVSGLPVGTTRCADHHAPGTVGA